MDYSNDYSEDDSTDEIARLGYLKWDPKFDLVYGTEKPYEMNMERPEWFPRTNMEMELGPEEKIHDIRTAKRTFSLDDNGFAYRHDPLATKNWDKLTVEREYLPSVERMMQAEFGDEAIVKIFQWRLRSSDPSKIGFHVGKVLHVDDPTEHTRPAKVVHVDQSEEGAFRRLRENMKEEADIYLQGRFQIVNVWRPLEHPIEDYPLAVCDGSSIDKSLLVCFDNVTQNYIGESVQVVYSDGLQWYYLSRQTKDEVMLIKIYDSSPFVKATCCPHTSFKQSKVPPGAKPRESIEVRVLVCYALPSELSD